MIQLTLLIWLHAEFMGLYNLSAKTLFLWHHHWRSHNVLAIKRGKKVYPFSCAQSSKVSCISKNEFQVYGLLKNIYVLCFRNLPLFYYSINPTNQGLILQIIKASIMAALFIFFVLTLKTIFNHKRFAEFITRNMK